MKNTLIAVVCLIVGAIIGYGVHGSSQNGSIVQGISSPGATNTSSKEYTITAAPSTAAATTTSLLNSDGTDREITSSFVACTLAGTSQTFLTGTGLAGWTVQMSTSTTGGLGLQGNVNYASNIAIGTSSPWVYVASTTEGVISPSRVWPSGTYLNITFNATNTAACTIGVHTVSL